MASPGLSLGLLRRRPAGITTDVSRSADEQQQHTHVGGDATPPSSAASRTSTARFSSIGDEDDGDMLEGMFVGSNKTRKRQQHPQGSSKSETLLAIAGFLFTMAGTAYVFPAVVLYLLYNIFAKGSALALAAAALLGLHMVVPMREGVARPGVIGVINRLMFRPWRRYFSFEIIRDAEHLDQQGVYIFATHPHGVFPMGQWLSNPHVPMDQLDLDAGSAHEQPVSPTSPAAGSEKKRAPQDIFPLNSVGGVASVLLHVPVFRYLFNAVGMIPVTKRKLAAAIESGRSVVIVAGGIAEIYACDTEKEMVVLKNRKGFIRLALQTSTPIVPVYCLGNSNVFRLARVSRRFTGICRAFRVAATLFYGRGFLPIPFRTKLVVLVGEPIPVPERRREPAAASPSGGVGKESTAAEEDQLVDALHAQYVEALCALYHRHKWRVPGWENRELVIV